MKFVLFVLLWVTSFCWAADEVKIEINPAKPVVGEVFRAYVRIFTDADDEPMINFVPSSLEVVGKSNQGVSTRTTYANGTLTVSREMTYVYELVGSRAGSASLRDINVEVGGKKIRHPSVSISILAEAEQKSDIFIIADVPKKEVFLGEGMLIRYYVYGKYTTPIKAIEVKKFPKLNNFLKRYLQEPENPERVTYDGEPYVRRLVYSAKLFPEKVGEIKIDSLQASVMFAQANSNDPFSAFGFSRDFRTRSVSSESITVRVKPLPEPVPSHFTGLIGRHEFSLDVTSSKLIVNEPLEMKLTVAGGGMLEGLEAPVLLKNPGFEEFETNGDLKIADANNATKTFEYTYLAKENLKLPPSTVTLSYFDPDSFRYVPTQLPFPEITVAGGTTTARKKGSSEPEEKSDQKKNETSLQPPPDFTSPILSNPMGYREFLPYVNFGVAALSLLLALSWFVKGRSLSWSLSTSSVPSHFRRGEFSLSEFVHWLSPLIQKTGKPPVAIIKESDLEDGAKTYFIDLLNANDHKEYSANGKAMQFVYQSSYFNSLSKYIESAKHESSSKS